MASKNFDKERVKKKGHDFTLGGETFRTYPGMSVNFLAGSSVVDEDAAPLKRTLDFIRGMVVADERERFDAMLASPQTYLEADDLLNVSTWLIEVISGRPTRSPGSSGNGHGRISTGSKAKPSEAAGETGKK